MTQAALEVEGLRKVFGTFTALAGVDLSVARGEVLGLLGENGAGKSTLIKILAGVYQRDGGSIRVAGAEQTFRSPTDAIDAGIVTVHQHSMLAPNLTVAENLVLGKEPRSRIPGLALKPATRAKATEMIRALDVDLPLNSVVGDLSLADRQRVEIVRAAYNASSLLILDEPTAALEPAEVDELMRLIRNVVAQGTGVIYVSHRLDEIPRICDRVLVLRDGRAVGELDREHAIPDEIIPLLAGRTLDALFSKRAQFSDAVVLAVEGLCPKGGASVSLSVRAGEVLGLTGAAGGGQREVARAICGAMPASGRLTVDGEPVGLSRPDRSVAAGIAYVSGDRATDGLFPDQSVWRNIAVGSLTALSRVGGLMNLRRERTLGREGFQRFGVRSSSANQEIGTLSGGNQQKALIARWALTSPRVLVLDEPTLGIDVGSRREIYDHLAELAATGMAVVIVSADNAELRGMADRVLVFDRGEVIAEMLGPDATEEAVLRARAAALNTHSEKAEQ
ncbi:sugar ABC transporter ATP-binding protein [Microbacterium sp. HMH0099]|uniref:sugar ABC transporter ATP-binding protein n=1 Tax=Microbacterium sp. HMH0099 TaxID=3414026 RepID=UPI003BF81735